MGFKIRCDHEHGGQSDHAACVERLSIQQAELDDAIARIRAEVWDEGYGAGRRTDRAAETQEPNPYRADRIGGDQ